ncbi:MAG: radical SAM protein [Candidatus Bathyarchaeia archaeon]
MVYRGHWHLSRLVQLLELKKKILEELGNRLSEGSRLKASGDHHSRRKPRPCGMTIHTGVGCSYSCAYCYIYDMGFTAKPKLYPLEPEEIAYALALNPYVIQGRTLAAYGSVTEPFLPETTRRAIDYMREVYRWLRPPTQISTKAILTEEILRGISLGDPRTSILVTTVTLSNRRVEPRAPDPVERIKFAGRASMAGFAVSLFMRPIIPGITDAEADKILGLAAENGVKSVALGSLRVTERILANLGRCGANIHEIKGRLARPPRGSEQVEVRSADLKGRIEGIAEDLGLMVFKAACEANVYAHGRHCAMCNMGPCNTSAKPEQIEDGDIIDLLEGLGVQPEGVEVTDTVVKVALKEKLRDDRIGAILALATYRRAILKIPKP